METILNNMMNSLRHFIRETLETLNIDGASYDLNLMQIGSPDYIATKQRFPRAGLILDMYAREFDAAKSMRIKYLDNSFVERLENLAKHLKKNGVNVDLGNIDTEALKDAMKEAVISAPLKIAMYEEDLKPHLEPTPEGNFIYDCLAPTTLWTKISKSIMGRTSFAFSFRGAVYSPPPILMFDKDMRLIKADLHYEASVKLSTLFVHELEHVESHAATEFVKNATNSSVDPAALDTALMRSIIRPASEITLTNMQDFVSRVNIDKIFSAIPQENDAATCAYLGLLAALLMGKEATEYTKAAITIANDASITNNLWKKINSIAADHASEEHIRISMLALAPALDALDTQVTDRVTLANLVIEHLKKTTSANQTFRSSALLAIIDVNKYELIKLVATADTPTTRNQA